jgi:hypothetical protein
MKEAAMGKVDALIVTTRICTRDGHDLRLETRAARLPWLTGLLRKATNVEVDAAGQPVDPPDDRPWGAVVTPYGTVRFSLPRPGQVAALAGMLRKAHTRLWVCGR